MTGRPEYKPEPDEPGWWWIRYSGRWVAVEVLGDAQDSPQYWSVTFHGGTWKIGVLRHNFQGLVWVKATFPETDLSALYQAGFSSLEGGEVTPPCPRCGCTMQPFDAFLVTGAECTNAECKWSMSEGTGCLA